MNELKVIVIAKFTTEEKNFSTLKNLLLQLKSLSRLEAGCLEYEILLEEGDFTKVTLYEEYQSQKAIELHRNTEHYQQVLTKEILPLLLTRELSVLHPLSVDQ